MRQNPPRRPIIGITSDLRSRRLNKNAEPELFLPRRYARAIEAAGGLPILLPPVRSSRAVRQMVDNIDGLVLSGGDFDIHPRYYGDQPKAKLGRLKPDRTRFEWLLGVEALIKDLPILGICGGAQLINVMLGGTLHQHLPTDLPSSQFHGEHAPRQHPVQVTPRTRLAATVNRQRLAVNSTHHQAVKRLGKHLTVAAKAPDGVIEAIESKAHGFVLGLQWHPEALAPEASAQRDVILAFVGAARDHTRTRSR